MSEHIATRAHNLLRFASQHQLKEILAGILGVVSFGYGLTFVLTAKSFSRTHTYDIALSWAAPGTWGAIFMILGALLVAVLVVNRQQAMWPSFAMTLVFGVLTVSNIFSLNVGGIPASIWLHLLATLISAVVTIACAYHQEPVVSKTITVVQTTAVG